MKTALKILTALLLLPLLVTGCSDDPSNPDDPAAPAVTITSPGSNATLGANFAISASVANAAAGIVYIRFYDNGVQLGSATMAVLEDSTAHNFNSQQLLIADLEDGPRTLRVDVVNNAGKTASHQISVMINKGTTPQKPQVTITSPAAGNVSNTIAIQAAASVTGSTISSVAFFLDGALLNTDTASPYASTGINTTTYPNGTVLQLKAVATAQNGLAATNSLNVTVINPVADTTPPTLTVTTPANGSTVSGSIQIGADAADLQSGVSRVDFFVDGTTQGSDTAAPYQSGAIDTTQLANGSHTVTVIAVNGVGLATTNSLNVTVDNQGDRTDLTLSLVWIADDYGYDMYQSQTVDVASPTIKWLNPIPVTGIMGYSVQVWDATEENLLWEIYNVAASFSQVAYGTIPAGASQLYPASGAPDTLDPSTSYVVNVIAWDNASTYSGDNVGAAHLIAATTGFSKSITRSAARPQRLSRADYLQLIAALRQR